jgi:glyoxylase-like metal-dependent hydrolase (beta-lactamase superfamily II)
MLEDTFGDIIGKARFGMGRSLSELAQRSGLSEARIVALEGGASPNKGDVERIALPLELDSDKLAFIARSAWTPKSAPKGAAETIRRIDGRIGNYPVNGYLLFDSAAKEGALFDTGYAPDQVLQAIKEAGVRLVALCVTHTHPDHIGGAERIASETGAPIYLHPDEAGKPSGAVPLREGMELSVGRFKVRPLRTPGHTPGGTTYFIEGGWPMASVGDALFAGSLGRAQSASTYPLLLQSVRSEIFTLPKETLLLPGHGPVTTVEEERAHNPFFRGSPL